MFSIAGMDPALRAAGLIGTWGTNVVIGRSILDEGAAILLAGNAALAGQPLPLEAALGRTHPEDREWLFEHIRRVRQTGGPFSAEFRVLSEANRIRWVLCRGSIEPDTTGAMRGRGTYIDTTDTHSGPFIPAAALNQDVEDSLTTAADHCIEAHKALERGGYLDLKRLADDLLLGVGQAIARRG